MTAYVTVPMAFVEVLSAVQKPSAYAVGVPAMFWTLDRVAMFGA